LRQNNDKEHTFTVYAHTKIAHPRKV